jgi:hypothetical protein
VNIASIAPLLTPPAPAPAPLPPTNIVRAAVTRASERTWDAASGYSWASTALATSKLDDAAWRTQLGEALAAFDRVTAPFVPSLLDARAAVAALGAHPMAATVVREMTAAATFTTDRLADAMRLRATVGAETTIEQARALIAQTAELGSTISKRLATSRALIDNQLRAPSRPGGGGPR